MRALMLYPEFPTTFWSFKHALRLAGKKSAFPPLGLLTVAALLPESWPTRLIDLNVEPLRARDLDWADCVFISGMIIQKASAREVVTRCKAAGVRMVVGGPLFNGDDPTFADVDHFVLGEAEITLPLFLADLTHGTPRRVYTDARHPELRDSPVPRWELAKLQRYASMCLQYSRGCPHNCDFCNVTALLGHRVRTKTTAQIMAELDALRANGWRGDVFFVDDNFIGNRHRLKTDLLPALIARRRAHKERTHFYTEASIELADDPELMRLMVAAGFNKVFIGIETPDAACLAECSKRQNENRDLVRDVWRIQRAGLQVQAGFIVGFDSDQASIFERQIDFIQRSGIVTAMVGLLQAPPGTRLYQRMKAQGRLLGDSTGDNADGTTNIVPLMGMERLQAGYREILGHIYHPKHYYERVMTFLRAYHLPEPGRDAPPTLADLVAFWRSLIRLGVMGTERLHFWKLLLWTGCRRPELLQVSMTLAICGYHYRKVAAVIRRPSPIPARMAAPDRL
ncbi:MAG: B12-binding domain-containing radical SAM protein [Candidatus Marinimicrobia bacterium]|nr:B12-binding domain-containing radical SAM protein [Candidatus Neomarinimicrobiota bacterium]